MVLLVQPTVSVCGKNSLFSHIKKFTLNHTVIHKKHPCDLFIITKSKGKQYSSLFHCRISKKILLQMCSPYLKYVTTLPCEIWMLKIATELSLIIQLKVN